MSHAFPSTVLNRLQLRAFRPDDIGEVYAALSHPQVIAHYGVSYPDLASTAEQMRWFEQIQAQGTGLWWAITERERDVVIGACGFNDWSHTHRHAHIGYWLMPEHWRKGLLSEALPWILRHAFGPLQIHRIHADVEPENTASCALLRKVGFQLEGTLRDVEIKDGRFLSLHQYSLLASDPAAQPYRGPVKG
ncbi:GNAT family N-acetyltransferase [Enterobacterales bacterium AW_CKDN230030176-1A_HGKHYDSX7]